VPKTASKSFTVEPFDYAEARALMDGLGLAEPIAITLVRRGHRTVEDARVFLEAADDHDPFLFEAMAKVCERIRTAVAAGRRITVHGDYDVDGVCSTAIVVRAVRELGGDCDWLIPGRQEDGYGLTLATIERLAARGTSLLVTTDCGIGSVEEVEAARAAGIEVIVTDHHQPGEALPECPILHPAISGYPFGELCATGVAYKLAVALHGAEATERELDLVALATVADLVPLRGENRALVRRGLAVARRARRPGIRALLATSSLAPERLDEGHFAFRLGPRINAAGRLYRADAGVELMLTTDQARADEIAGELERANQERRAIEREVLDAAEASRRELPDELADARGLVLAGEGWHPGVVGIVASRLVERHRRPVVLISLGADGRGRGSGRSIPGFDLLAGLRACDAHLSRYGGHRAAAGLEIEAGEVDAFRAAFTAHCAEALADAPAASTEIVDAVVGGESLGHEVAEQLARLAPFGKGNPGVRWLVPAASVGDVRPMGEGDRHSRFTLTSGPSRALGVAFGVNGSLAAVAGAPVDVSLSLELNEWNGAVEPRVVLGTVYPPELAADPVAPGRETEEATGVGSEAPTGMGSEEFWSRHERELALELSAWTRVAEPTSGIRELIARRGSATAAIAALASSGETVLALCADAIRRRQLVERAARPGRFGGGELAIVSARLSDAAVAAAETRVTAGGCGVILADWAALARDPGLAARCRHVVVIDPAPFPHLDRLVERGDGYLHRFADGADVEFALRVHADEWPSRSSLAELYRALGASGGALEPAAARAVLCGEGRAHPHSPEVTARAARVLAELALLRWDGSGANRVLRVVSSSGTDLEGSEAFVAYRDRHEEGRRYLSERRQT
jgi:single-stranded-DNA-specific exonuclease